MKTDYRPKEIEIYIHIPFCERKCNYCDFLSFSSPEETRERYTDALCREIRETGEAFRSREGFLCAQNDAASLQDRRIPPVRSIFFGGGTPSILKEEQLEKIFCVLQEIFPIDPKAEISLEANPGTLNPGKLKFYRSMGINRLSIGLQSTEDDLLGILGRIHTYAEFRENYHSAREAGFDNINIDIMSGLPGQSEDSYGHTLRRIASFQPEHISSYSLILEEGTPFYTDRRIQNLLPDEETERRMYEMTVEILEREGYHRYEISNYAREGRECLHNLGYWEDVPYLGFGLGASSYWKNGDQSLRFSNIRDLGSYLVTPFLPIENREECRILSREDQMEEFMFLGLRKTEGVLTQDFQRRFGCGIEEIFGKPIKQFLEMGFLTWKDSRLSLTTRGINVSNQIFCEFLL